MLSLFGRAVSRFHAPHQCITASVERPIEPDALEVLFCFTLENLLKSFEIYAEASGPFDVVFSHLPLSRGQPSRFCSSRLPRLIVLLDPLFRANPPFGPRDFGRTLVCSSGKRGGRLPPQRLCT